MQIYYANKPHCKNQRCGKKVTTNGHVDYLSLSRTHSQGASKRLNPISGNGDYHNTVQIAEECAGNVWKHTKNCRKSVVQAAYPAS